MLVPISGYIKKASEQLKDAMPYLHLKIPKGHDVDLVLELLSPEDRKKVISDIESGKEITLPNGDKVSLEKLEEKPSIVEKKDIAEYLKKYVGKPSGTPVYVYDASRLKYEPVNR